MIVVLDSPSSSISDETCSSLSVYVIKYVQHVKTTIILNDPLDLEERLHKRVSLVVASNRTLQLP